MSNKKSPTKTAAVGYVRVSTGRQAREGVSLDVQRAKILAYCEIHDLKLLATFSDPGRSGRRADNRPGLKKAIQRAAESGGVLIVYNLSRLSRSLKDLLEVSLHLKKSGADLASMQEAIDTTTAAGKLYFNIIASFAQFYSDNLSEQITLAMAYKRAVGEKTGGHPPFGYDKGPAGLLLVNSAEQNVLTEIRRWRRMEWSLHKIARRLNHRRVPTKLGKTWYAQTVKSVLASSAKIGKRTHGKAKKGQ